MAGNLEHSNPRVAVIGSCISRDTFNTRILGEDYKDSVSIVSTVYQTSLPSLGREVPVQIDLVDQVKSNHRLYLEQELSGRSISRLISSKPDVIVMDFFSDIHFGTAGYEGETITRNTMAFESYQAAEEYYTENTEQVERFEWVGDDYTLAALGGLDRLIVRLKDAQLNPVFITNSGRYAISYRAKNGEIKTYDRNIKNLIRRNHLWDELDELVTHHTEAARIVYPDDLIVGDESHEWGLHPVHYKKEYYKHMWRSLKKLLKE